MGPTMPLRGGRQAEPLERRFALPVALTGFVIAAVVAFAISSAQPATFEARTILSEDTTESLAGLDPIATEGTSQRLQLYARMARHVDVLTGAIDRLGADISPEALARRLEARVSDAGDVLELRVQHREPALAAALANAVAQEVSAAASRESGVASTLAAQIDAELSARMERMRALERIVARLRENVAPTALELQRLGRLSRSLQAAPRNVARLMPYSSAGLVGPLRVVDPAVTPAEPVEPRPLLDGLLGGILGMLFVLPLVVVPHLLDGVIRDPDDLRMDVGLATLAVVPAEAAASRRRSTAGAVRGALMPGVVDAYRSAAIALEVGLPRTGGRALLVTAPRRTATRSAVAAGLAAASAERGQRVVLIDGDIAQPGIHRLFGLEDEEGLADALAAGSGDLGHLLRSTEHDGLRVLTAGARGPHRGVLVASPAMRELLVRLRAQHDLVVIDAPPVRESPSAELLGPQADGVVIVITAGRSRRDDAGSSVRSLAEASAPLMGALLVHAPRRWRPGGWR